MKKLQQRVRLKLSPLGKMAEKGKLAEVFYLYLCDIRPVF